MYESFVPDLHKLHEDLDIANVKFTYSALMQINRLQQEGFKIIDSADADREEMLRYNEEINTVVPKRSIISLPIRKVGQSLKSYIEQLDNTSIYDINYTDPEEYQYALIAIINISRPSIQFQLNTRLNDLMSLIKYNMRLEAVYDILEKESEILLYSNLAILPKKLEWDKNDCIEVYGHGKVDRDSLASNFTILPINFGKTVLLDYKPLSVLISSCLKIIKNVSDEDSNTMRNFILSFESKNN